MLLRHCCWCEPGIMARVLWLLRMASDCSCYWSRRSCWGSCDALRASQIDSRFCYWRDLLATSPVVRQLTWCCVTIASRSLSFDRGSSACDGREHVTAGRCPAVVKCVALWYYYVCTTRRRRTHSVCLSTCHCSCVSCRATPSSVQCPVARTWLIVVSGFASCCASWEIAFSSCTRRRCRRWPVAMYSQAGRPAAHLTVGIHITNRLHGRRFALPVSKARVRG